MNGCILDERELKVEFQGTSYNPKLKEEKFNSRQPYGKRDYDDNRRRPAYDDRRRSRDDRYGNKSKSQSLFVGNLSFGANEHDLKDFFRQIGKVNEVRVSTNEFGKNKGFAYVEFKYPEDVEKAIFKLNGQQLDGRALKLDTDRTDNTRTRRPPHQSDRR